MKIGVNGRTASTTNSCQGITVVVCSYLMLSEKICQVPKTVKTGKYKSFIKKVLFMICLSEAQGKSLVLSRNRPLELTLVNGLKVSSVSESKCRKFKLTMVAH